LMLELLASKSSIGYGVVKVPVLDVLIWFPLIDVPSQLSAASMGRLADKPPGSEHSMICSPLGRADRMGKPVPVTVITWPSVKGPLGMLTVSPCA
jgi:hypothetical protein